MCRELASQTTPRPWAEVSSSLPADENPKQHVPLAEFAANLKSMVQQLRAAGVPAAGLVLITPPPLCEAAWEQECLRQGQRPLVGGGEGGGQPASSPGLAPLGPGIRARGLGSAGVAVQPP